MEEAANGDLQRKAYREIKTESKWKGERHFLTRKEGIKLLHSI